ncbi:hypothetical protein L249_0888 [Ophiocordyceps polyrhachis-furcata BCC 54312]|uniref:Uncharacterized protein n=1 Tax=Ophiocordyceps polyrhachis-furcata BCC 54312 TaxID=1330021 RepID=A0A367LCZ4_9HYPO|nr:hypothetical protein L249_0888 [Ophiocordyceps polyrhachis-furcata BCC 54312]
MGEIVGKLRPHPSGPGISYTAHDRKSSSAPIGTGIRPVPRFEPLAAGVVNKVFPKFATHSDGSCPVEVPEAFKGKVSSVRPQRVSGKCSFYLGQGCTDISVEGFYPGRRLYGHFDNKIHSVRCNSEVGVHESRYDSWTWSNQTRQDLCKHVYELWFYIKLSPGLRSVALHFNGFFEHWQVPWLMNVTSPTTPEGSDWYRVDMKDIFTHSPIPLQHLVGKMSLTARAIRGGELKIVDAKLVARCTDSDIALWMNSFSIHAQTITTESPPTAEWTYDVTANDWAPVGPCSYFQKLKVSVNFISRTKNKIYATMAGERLLVVDQPRARASYTTEVQLYRVYKSRIVTPATVSRISLSNEGGDTGVAIESVTLDAVCSGSSTGYQLVIKRDDDVWLMAGKTWDLDIKHWKWKNEV